MAEQFFFDSAEGGTYAFAYLAEPENAPYWPVAVEVVDDARQQRASTWLDTQTAAALAAGLRQLIQLARAPTGPSPLSYRGPSGSVDIDLDLQGTAAIALAVTTDAPPPAPTITLDEHKALRLAGVIEDATRPAGQPAQDPASPVAGSDAAPPYGRFRLIAPADSPWPEHRAFDAVDTESGEPALLVVLDPGLAEHPGFDEAFQKLSRIDTAGREGALPVIAAGKGSEGAWIAVRRNPPPDVAQYVTDHGPLAPDSAASIITTAARAMAADHAEGRAHGGGGPRALLITGGGPDASAVLSPRALNPALYPHLPDDASGYQPVVVALESSSPEELQGKDADARTDVYALGCTLHMLVTGWPAYDRESDVATMFAHMSEPPPSVRAMSPDLPEWIDAALERAMAKEPAERPADGPALAATIESLQRAADALEVAGEVPPLDSLVALKDPGVRPRRVASEVLSAPSRLVFHSTVTSEDLTRAFPTMRVRPGITFTTSLAGDHEILQANQADLMDAFESDGSPLSFVHASLLAREGELRGDTQWYLHELLYAPPGPPSGAADWKWIGSQATRWEPAVERRPDQTVLVTFHTIVTTFEDRLFRHRDLFTGPGYRFTPHDELIARHPHGPRIPW